MRKTSTVALIAALTGLGGAFFTPAMATEPSSLIRCQAPVLQLSEDPRDSVVHYAVTCEGASQHVVTPKITFSGELAANGSAPYLVKASYTVDARSAQQKSLYPDQPGQVMTGRLQTSTQSLAVLPAQFADNAIWDPHANALSVKEKPGLWHIFSANYLALPGDAMLVDAGYASEPIVRGQSKATLTFGNEFSRFAGQGSDLPVLQALLGLRDGKLELTVGASRLMNQERINKAMVKLDQRPKDIARAWALASIAQFLGLQDEVRYAEKKVAALNPHLLEEFQLNLKSIVPFDLPR